MSETPGFIRKLSANSATPDLKTEFGEHTQSEAKRHSAFTTTRGRVNSKLFAQMVRIGKHRLLLQLNDFNLG